MIKKKIFLRLIINAWLLTNEFTLLKYRMVVEFKLRIIKKMDQKNRWIIPMVFRIEWLLWNTVLLSFISLESRILKELKPTLLYCFHGLIIFICFYNFYGKSHRQVSVFLLFKSIHFNNLRFTFKQIAWTYFMLPEHWQGQQNSLLGSSLNK